MNHDRNLSWHMVRFTGLQDGPVFVDLCQVAAVTEAYSQARTEDFSDAMDRTLPGLPIGARVVLNSGTALFVKQSAEAVFEEVHRARTMPPPVPDKIRVGDPAL